MERGVRLARELTSARTAEAAVRSAARFLSEGLQRPAAAWCGPPGVGRLRFVGSYGTERRASDAVRRAFAEVPRLSRLSVTDRKSLIAEIGSAIGSAQAMVADAGDALIAIADPAKSSRRAVADLGALLSETLGRIDERARALARDERLDLGLALTAHEMSSPLLAARAALDEVLDGGPAEGLRAVVRSARDEIERLAELVGPLMRWATGEGKLSARQFDLVSLIREVCRREERAARPVPVRVSSPTRVQISGDPRVLGNAFGNLVRNALSFAPVGTEVLVEIGREGAWVVVKVRDRGPGVPAQDRTAVFDPYVRSSSAFRTRAGAGLGLFLARRVIEGHGGTIGIEPGRRGATFVVQLPRGRRVPRST